MVRKFVLALALCLCLVLTGCSGKTAADTGDAWGTVPDWGAALRGMTVEEEISAAQMPLGELDGFLGPDELVTVDILSAEAIQAAMDVYGIEPGSTAAQALEAINGTYAARISAARRRSSLVFFFEGAGSVSDPKERRDAMCVVVWDGQVIYLNLESTTIPDWPFVPWKNEGWDVPTLKSGIYDFDTVNHNGQYAALRVLDDRVVRFHTAWEFYDDVSNKQSIQIHRRIQDEISPADEAWGSSVGCLLVGDASTAADASYAEFIQAVGLVPDGARGNSRYQTKVWGTVIVDRSFGAEYLLAVGYPEEALEQIGIG